MRGHLHDVFIVAYFAEHDMREEFAKRVSHIVCIQLSHK